MSGDYQRSCLKDENTCWELKSSLNDALTQNTYGMTGFTDPQADTGAKSGEFRTKNKHQVAPKHKREHMLALVIIA